MSITQARPAATEDRLHSDLVKIWAALPPGPWTVQGANPAHELAEAVLSARYPDSVLKDYAAASFWIGHLTARGFVTARRHPDSPRTTIYEKVPTPPEPDRRSYVEKEQQQLDQAARRERERLDQEAEFARSLAEQQAALDPMLGQVAAALRRLGVIDRTGVEQVTAAAVAPLREQVAELAQQLTAAIEELAQLRESIEQTPARRFGRRAQ